MFIMTIAFTNFNINLAMTKIRYHWRCERSLAANAWTSATPLNNRESELIPGHSTKDCGLACIQAA